MHEIPGEPHLENPSFQAESAEAQAESMPFDIAAAEHQQAMADLRAENADLRDKLLRAIAETENFRRRAEREKADVIKYAVTEFARDIVSVGDNLRRAIDAVQREPLDRNPALKTLLEGVEVTDRELMKVFERQGVTRFDPMGEKFDPHFHEAMIKVDVPNVAADVIVQVLQAGYRIGERTLRPAAVIVAKGGTAAPQPLKETHDADAEEANQARPSQAATPGDAPAAQFQNAPGARSQHPGAAGPAANSAPVPPKRERQAGEKRSSTVTQPVTENSGQIKKDDLISSFGKRLESGS